MFLQFGRLVNGGLCRYTRRYSVCFFSRERSYISSYIVVDYVLRVTESLCRVSCVDQFCSTCDISQS